VRMQNSLVFSVVDRPCCTLPGGPRLDRERRAGRQAYPAQLVSHDAETECDKVLAARQGTGGTAGFWQRCLMRVGVREGRLWPAYPARAYAQKAP
jgi:hypothetical protein